MNRQELLRELQGTKCRCGKTKRPGHTFYRGCYYSLPPGMRQALYLRFGDGYEAAYAAAAAQLDGRASKVAARAP